MLETNLPAVPPTSRPFASLPVPGLVQAAKWPPEDDDDVPDAPTGGGGGGGGMPIGGGDDGNFKKGRFNPLVVLVGVIAVAGLVAFLLIGAKQDAEKLTVQQGEDIKKAIFILPKEEQAPKWREWAVSDRSDELRAEALKQLAWFNDPAGVDFCIQGLKYPSEPIQSMAAIALAQYGSPAADKAKGPLLEALKTAGTGAKPQIAWALISLGEPQAFDAVLQLYRLGHLANVQRLGGGNAFDAEKLVKMVSTDKLASMAGDESPGVRQLVATVLSRLADAKYTDVLIKLVNDADKEVARQAAPGLGRIGDERARTPLITALKTADKDDRKKFLEALRDGIGTAGLVLALEGIDEPDANTAWFQRKALLGMIRELADPRGGDSLNRFLAGKPHIHWETEAATAMAEVGDVRAVPTLAKRLRMDPLKIYSDQNDNEMALKRDDNERVVAARMIADLSMLHPEAAAQIRQQAEDAVIFWIHELPSPHANGLRALAAMGSTKDIAVLRKWADPDQPLPKLGQQPPMPEQWVIAQSAMRYIGWLKDEQSWKVLERGLKRRSSELDITMEGLMLGGRAILGMTLRAVGVGASDGFSQWGDARAFKPLLAYIDEPMENEQSRTQACAALPWVGTKEDLLEVAKKIQAYNKTDKADSFRRACLLESMIARPVPGTAGALLPMLTPDSAIETRHQVARAIGKAGFDKDIEAKLFEAMKTESLMTDAALALILGGDAGTAARAVAFYADKPKEALEELGTLWFSTFGYWSTEDLESGRIFRWVDAAVAISHLEIRQTAQEWARVLLMKQFDNLDFDNGPHSFTRVVLRFRLWKMAEGQDQAQREGAIRTLKFMSEKGVLQALRDGKGPGAEQARQAFFELVNPKVVSGVNVPANKKDEKADPQ